MHHDMALLHTTDVLLVVCLREKFLCADTVFFVSHFMCLHQSEF